MLKFVFTPQLNISKVQVIKGLELCTLILGAVQSPP